MKGLLGDICENTLNEMVEKWCKEGKSEAEIEGMLNSRLSIAIEKVIDKSCKNSVEYMREHMCENELIWASRDAEFLAKQNQKWGMCFAASRMMYTSAIEMADSYTKYITTENKPDSFEEIQYTFYSLVHLHGRACQEFLEILTLMKEGFADGAYARCRSLFELCCVASFIKLKGETVAMAYYQQSNTAQNDKSYAWAGSFTDDKGNKVRSFKQIQDMCDLPKQWQDGYDVGCLVTHASPQGTFGRLSNGIGINVIPAGRSDYGIKIPAEHSALCLQWITATLLTLFPNADSISQAKTLGEWADIVREMYYTAHDEVFSEAIKAGKAE